VKFLPLVSKIVVRKLGYRLKSEHLYGMITCRAMLMFKRNNVTVVECECEGG